MSDIEKRVRFEAWARSKGHDPSVRLILTSHPPQDGGYASPGLNDLWDAWKSGSTPPEGYVLLPLVPTQEMVVQGTHCTHAEDWEVLSAWIYMLGHRPGMPL